MGKQYALSRLRAGALPVTLGAPHPFVAIVEQDGVFRVRELVVDQAASRRAFEAARAAGRSFQPEHHYALGQPTGRIFYEAPTLEALAALLEGIEWPREW
jgi:hypothetical protein